MKYLPKLSKMPLDSTLSSSLQSWLGHELEVRGIDAVIYTRYVLSILQQEDFETDIGEREFFPRSKKAAVVMSVTPSSKSPTPGGGLSTATGKTPKGNQRSKKKTSGCSTLDKSSEEWKKYAAVECLLSVSDEDSGIEGLVDELYIKLKQQSGVAVDRSTTVADPESSDSVISTSPDDAVERYYAAFPALTDRIEDTSTQPRPPTPEMTWSTIAQKSSPDGDLPGEVENESKDLVTSVVNEVLADGYYFMGRNAAKSKKGQGKISPRYGNGNKSPYGNRVWKTSDYFSGFTPDAYVTSCKDHMTFRGKSQERAVNNQCVSPKFGRQSSCPDFNVHSNSRHPAFIVPKIPFLGFGFQEGFPSIATLHEVIPAKITLQEIFGTEEVSEIEPCKTLVVDGQLVRLCATSMNSNNLDKLTNICLKEAPMEENVANKLWQEFEEELAGRASSKDEKTEGDHKYDNQETSEVTATAAEEEAVVFVGRDDAEVDTDLEDPVWYTGPIDLIAPDMSPITARPRLYRRSNPADEFSSQPQSSCATPTFNRLWEEVWDDSGVYIGAKLKDVASGDEAAKQEEDQIDFNAARNVDILTESSSETESDYIDMSGCAQAPVVIDHMVSESDHGILTRAGNKSPDRLQIFKELAGDQSETAAFSCDCEKEVLTPKQEVLCRPIYQGPIVSQYKGCIIPEITQNKVPDDRPVFFLDEPELNNNHNNHSASAKDNEQSCFVTCSCTVNNLLSASHVPFLSSRSSASASAYTQTSSTSDTALSSFWSSASPLCSLVNLEEPYNYRRGSRALFARGSDNTVSDSTDWPCNISSIMRDIQIPKLSSSSSSSFLTCTDYLLITNSIWRDPPVTPSPKIWDINMSSRKITVESPLENTTSFSSDISKLVFNLEYDNLNFMKGKEEANFIEGGLYGGTLSNFDDAWSLTRSDCSEDEGICDQEETCSFPLSPEVHLSSYKTGSLDHLDAWFSYGHDDQDYMNLWTNSLTGSMELLPSETSAFSSEALPSRLPHLPHVRSEPCISPRQPVHKCVKNKYRMVQVKHLYKPDTSILRHLGLTSEVEEREEEEEVDEGREVTPEHHFKPITTPLTTATDSHGKKPASVKTDNLVANQDYVLLEGISQGVSKKEDDNETLTGSVGNTIDLAEELASLTGSTRSGSGTLYQLYKGAETANVSFIPRFRICRELQDKYIQTGESPQIGSAEGEMANQELAERILIELLRTSEDVDCTNAKPEHEEFLVEKEIGEREEWQSYDLFINSRDEGSDKDDQYGNYVPSPNDLARLWGETAIGGMTGETRQEEINSSTSSYDLASIWGYPTDEIMNNEQKSNVTSWDLLPKDQELEVDDIRLPQTSSPNLESTLTQSFLEDLITWHNKKSSLDGVVNKSPITASEAQLDEINPEGDGLHDMEALRMEDSFGDVSEDYENESWDISEERVSPTTKSHPIPIPLPGAKRTANVVDVALNNSVFDPRCNWMLDHDTSLHSEGENMMFVMDTSDHIPGYQTKYSTETEEHWLNSVDGLEIKTSTEDRKMSKYKKGGSTKLCTFYLEGKCQRMDCRYSHDVSTIMCRFWADGDCFKGIACPFLHG